jgi:hydrogenase maturation protease
VRVRVIGVGTRHGDDVAGLLAAERLAAARLPDGVHVTACEGAPLDLVDALAGADGAIVVDACPGAGPEGSARRVATAELDAVRPVSSHGLGVGAALELAAALGRAPARVALVGIAASRGRAAPASALARGVAEAELRVREILAEWGLPGAEG